MVIMLMAWLGLMTIAGCSGNSTFLSGGPTAGQLKTSLSHLEYENLQLKRSVAKLEQENRTIEDRLVKEQLDNGDLIARLNDARNLLRDRGEEKSELARTRRDDSQSTRRTAPAQDPPRGSCHAETPKTAGRPDSRPDRTRASTRGGWALAGASPHPGRGRGRRSVEFPPGRHAGSSYVL